MYDFEHPKHHAVSILPQVAEIGIQRLEWVERFSGRNVERVSVLVAAEAVVVQPIKMTHDLWVVSREPLWKGFNDVIRNRHAVQGTRILP
jgi:hypothetical protein